MSVRMHRYENGLDGLAAFCDTCGDQITEHGFVIWDPDNVADWRVIHQARCDPGREAGYTCSMDLEVEIIYLANSTKSDLTRARKSVSLFQRIG